MQFETYREIALKALKRATVTPERPQPVTYILPMQVEMKLAASSKEAKIFDKSDDSFARQKITPFFKSGNRQGAFTSHH